MSNACFLEFFKIIQDDLAEGPLIIAEFGIVVFQINGFRFVELVIKEITVGKVGLNHRCLIIVSENVW